MTPGKANAIFAFVASGLVKLSVRHESGRETILRLYSAGDWLDDGSVFLGRPEHGDYVAMQDGSEIVTVDRQKLRDVLDQSRQATQAMMAEMARGHLEMRERVEDLAITPVPRRIARLLARLTDRHGLEREDGKILLPLPLSRQDLADMCGTTIETTIRVMSRLQTQRVVTKSREGFMIEEPRTLQTIGSGQTELRVR